MPPPSLRHPADERNPPEAVIGRDGRNGRPTCVPWRARGILPPASPSFPADDRIRTEVPMSSQTGGPCMTIIL